MKFTVRNLNRFLLVKLPSAFFTGVRVESLITDVAVVRVRHRWINQNPFKSLYFAVLAMAAELSTGVLVLQKTKASGKSISTLVVKQKAEFTKKAKGLIRFTCFDGAIIDDKIKATLNTGEGQTFLLKSVGMDEQGEQVAIFEFEWSVKMK